MTKLSAPVVQHLHNAKALISTKIEVWHGREPFPVEALDGYKRMLNDVNFELHDFETTDQPMVVMSAHLGAVLTEYRTLLEDTIQFWTGTAAQTAQTYEQILKNLDSLLAATQIEQGTPNPPVTKRPRARCAEFGKCKVKIITEQSRSASPMQTPDGEWRFDDPNIWREKRQCATCGREWETSYNHGRSGTAQTKPPSVMIL